MYLLYLCCALLYGTIVASNADPDLKCGACRVVVDELVYSIRTQDLNKTVETGSFRIDPNGNTMTKKIPYTRSDTQLTHLLDSVCGSMGTYGQASDKETGRLVFMRTESRDGKPLEIGEIKTGSEVTNWLKMACESLVDDYNDEIKEIFMKNESNPEERICVKLSKVCTVEQLQLVFHAPVIKEFTSDKADPPASESDDTPKEDRKTEPKEGENEKKDEL